jgi:hypothetical protein
MADESLGDLLSPMHAAMHTEYGTWSDEDRVWHVKETVHWRVLVMPMLFNYRLVISSTEFPIEQAGYTAGWCYDKGPAAFLAALAYDPETAVEPVGYKKRAMDARGGSLL